MDDGIARALKDLRPYIAGALKDLRRNWGGAYEITEAPGVWRAMRLDNQATLIAIGPRELRDLITADCTAQPVPRSCPCPEIRPARWRRAAGAAARSGVPARMRPVRAVPDGMSFGAAGSLRPHPSVPGGGGLLGWPA